MRCRLALLLLCAAVGCSKRDDRPRPRLVVAHAGSLAAPLRAALDSFSASTGTSIATISAGSVELARRVTELRDVPDVIALADEEVFPKLLMPEHVRWYVTFASNRMVVAEAPRARHARDFDSLAWWRVLSRRGVEVGRSDPTLDPAGYRALMVLQLAERTYAVPGLADSVLARSPSRNVRPKSSDLIALLQTGALDYAFVYQSSARNAGLRWLELPAAMNLGDDSSAAIYATASVRIPGRTRGDTVVVTGAPIRYALSVPVAAENATSAEALVVFLITRRGRAILRASGLDVDVTPLVVGEGAPQEVRDALVARTVRADTAH